MSLSWDDASEGDTSAETLAAQGIDDADKRLRISGICLAAGSSSRMGSPKLGKRLPDGTPLGSPAVEALTGAGLDRVIVVVREGDDLSWMPKVGVSESSETAAEIAVCRDAGLGMSHSLRCGLELARQGLAGDRVDAVLVVLADQPFIDARLLSRLEAQLQSAPELDWAACSQQGVPMPPAILRASMFEMVLQLEGDQGARHLFQRADFKGKLLSDMRPESLLDADTPADFAEISRLWL